MWTKLAQLRFAPRCLLKAALFGIVLAAVLYPHPVLLGRQVRHLRSLESLIQPAMPALADINREIDQRLPADATPKAAHKAVERYVYDHVRFQYDWDNWGNVDYWPTAAEVWERRREDCDGRAVLAVTILRSRGFANARLVGNLAHIWVEVNGTELMGPQADKSFRREGNRTILSLPSARTLLESLAMVHEFPTLRSLIVLFSALVLCFHPCRSGVGFGAVTILALAGFVLLMHWAGLHLEGRVTINGAFAGGVLLLVAAFVVAALLPRWLKRRDHAAPCELALPNGQR